MTTLSNSEKEVPKTRLALQEKYDKEKKKKKNHYPLIIYKDLVSKLPQPSGWENISITFYAKRKNKGGIIIAQESLEKLRTATNCGYVIKMGPLCYNDSDKFPTGQWCKEGDWVIFARYAGSRLPIEGGEVRLLNDDEVLGTISDPESVLHYI